MIYLKQMDEYADRNENCWWIVRKPDRLPANAKWVPELSPDPKLFEFYMSYYDKGTWTKKHFDELYVSWFIRDLKNNKEGLALLSYLKEAGQKEDFTLYCYCENEYICHRSIIGGILLHMGADIECNEEYRKYGLMFEKENKI